MVEKEKLIQMLEEAVSFEEKAMPLLEEKCRECFREIKGSGMIVEEDKRKMLRMLRRLVSDADTHRLDLGSLIQKVKRSHQREF